jgi:DHA1 family multidrug resistance protein-like MFS transporter
MAKGLVNERRVLTDSLPTVVGWVVGEPLTPVWAFANHTPMQQAQQPLISWKRNLAVLWLAGTCVAIGFTFSFPFMPLFLQDMGLAQGGRAALWSGIIQVSMGVGMVLSGPVWGLAADRYGRKKNVVRAMFGGGAFMLLSAFSTSLYHLIILRFLTGVSTGSMGPSMALLASTTPRERIPFAIGILQTSFFVGNTIGPFLGGLVADSWGLKGTFLATGTMLGVGGVIALLLAREEFHRPSQSVSIFQRRAYANLLRLLTSRELKPVLTVVFSVQVLPIMTFTVLPLILDDLSSMGGGSVTGVAFGVMGLAGGLGSYLAGQLSGRVSSMRILRMAVVGAALSFAPLAVANSVGLFYLFLGLGGAFQGSMIAMTGGLVALAVSGEEQGVAFGGLQAVQVSAFSIGPLVGGGIGATAGLRWVFPVQTFGLLALSVAMARLLPGEAVSGLQRAVATTAEADGQADSDRAPD